MKKKRFLKWKYTVKLASSTLCIYAAFSLVMICWCFYITNWEQLIVANEDFVLQHSCLSVLLLDTIIFLWTVFGVFLSFQKHTKKSTIYGVFLFVLLVYKIIYGIVFATGGSEIGYEYQKTMLTKWEQCCSANENKLEIYIWRICNLNEFICVAVMFFLGNFSSFSLYHISIQ